MLKRTGHVNLASARFWRQIPATIKHFNWRQQIWCLFFFLFFFFILFYEWIFWRIYILTEPVISDAALCVLYMRVLHGDLQVMHRSIFNCFLHCIVLGVWVNTRLGSDLQSFLKIRSPLSLMTEICLHCIFIYSHKSCISMMKRISIFIHRLLNEHNTIQLILL